MGLWPVLLQYQSCSLNLPLLLVAGEGHEISHFKLTVETCGELPEVSAEGETDLPNT